MQNYMNASVITIETKLCKMFKHAKSQNTQIQFIVSNLLQPLENPR